MKMTKLLAVAAIAGFAGCGQSNLGGSQIIEEGQPPVVIHSTVEAAQAAREAAGTGVVGDARGTAGTTRGAAAVVIAAGRRSFRVSYTAVRIFTANSMADAIRQAEAAGATDITNVQANP